MRGFELLIYQNVGGVTGITLITRQQDAFVCAVVDGLAKALAGYWNGEIIPPG